MKKTIFALMLLLATFMAHGNVDTRELLSNVDPGKYQRLTEYNSTYLKEKLYFSKRHRIVKANTNLLMEGDELTITPFDDVQPFHIITEASHSHEDMYYFKAHIILEREILEELSKYNIPGISFPIGLFAWDIDEHGGAHLSISNRLIHSPEWQIDEYGKPELIPPKGVSTFVISSPPEGLRQIQRHQKVQALMKHQFYSVNATFSSLDGKKYVLSPLKFTPKYSVIYELDRDMTFKKMCGFGDQQKTIEDEELLKISVYESFKRSLPKETDKVVLADID